MSNNKNKVRIVDGGLSQYEADFLKESHELMIAVGNKSKELLNKYEKHWKKSDTPIYYVGCGFDEKRGVIELAHGANREEVVKIMDGLGYSEHPEIDKKVAEIFKLKEYAVEILQEDSEIAAV